jgi:hypothetical protein
MRMDHEVVLDGRTYHIYQFGAEEGLELGLHLTKLAAPILAPLMAMGGEAAFTVDVAERVAKAAVTTLEPKAMVALVKRMMTVVTVDGVEGDADKPGGPLDRLFEVHFAGKTGLILKVVREVVMHNFADFFSGLGGLIPGAGTR